MFSIFVLSNDNWLYIINALSGVSTQRVSVHLR